MKFSKVTNIQPYIKTSIESHIKFLPSARHLDRAIALEFKQIVGFFDAGEGRGVEAVGDKSRPQV